MSAADPDEIWRECSEEGGRRLQRGSLGLFATGLNGGADVMLGVLALTVVSGALAISLPEQIAHVGGSLVFGIGFVAVIVGRSELFTENFLVPVAGVAGGHGKWTGVGRLWGITLVGNLLAILALAAVFVRAGVMPPDALKSAGVQADTFASRDIVAAGLSAVLAGGTMTVMTWMTHAVDSSSARILVILLMGFILAAPSLNHAIVGFGEMTYGLLAGTPEKATWIDLAQNVPVSIVGNLIGGLLFVTFIRVLQVQGEPAE